MRNVLEKIKQKQIHEEVSAVLTFLKDTNIWADTWIMNENLGRKASQAKRTVSSKSLSWNWLSCSRVLSKKLFKTTVQFSLGSYLRHKPVYMAGLNNLMNWLMCLGIKEPIWVLFMSSFLLNVIRIWIFSSIDFEKET